MSEDYPVFTASYSEARSLVEALALEMGLTSQKAIGILAIEVMTRGYGNGASPYRRYFSDMMKTAFWDHKRGRFTVLGTYTYDVGQSLEVALRPMEYFDIAKESVLRACPVVPRHGILENKIIKAEFSPKRLELVENLAKQMMAQGSTDIVLQPYQRDYYNVVANDYQATIGPTPSAVTDHSSKTFTVPFSLKPFYPLIRAAGEDPSNVELEFLCSPAYRPMIVQIRRAPEGIKPVCATGKWEGFGFDEGINLATIPHFLVHNLGDLAELEEMNLEGIIVHVKGSLNSHAAAWARTKGLPYLVVDSYRELADLIAKKVTLYSLGVRVNDKPYKKVPKKAHAFTRVFNLGRKFGAVLPFGTTVNHEEITCTHIEVESKLYMSILLGMSYISGWPHNRIGAFYAGVGTAFLPRLALMLCLGESRHRGEIRRDLLDGGIPEFPMLDYFTKDEEDEDYYEEHRQVVYKRFARVQPMPEQELLRLSMELEQLFCLPWNDSYGGNAWRKATILARRALLAKGIKSVASSFNALVNACHNGGWFLNKVGHKEVFDAISSPHQCPAKYLEAMADTMKAILDIIPLKEKGGKYVPLV